MSMRRSEVLEASRSIGQSTQVIALFFFMPHRDNHNVAFGISAIKRQIMSTAKLNYTFP